ncbi:hypothetical protein R3P38DRAFT_3172437 [Favolaschia claudopus]|uniref:Uncharacterized protein n=1 Tax=Favolaschia claudopus TaxID=2862362 RepID=A0AAW0DJZ1_9AGAR
MRLQSLILVFAAVVAASAQVERAAPVSNGAPGWKRDPSGPIAEDGAPGWKRDPSGPIVEDGAPGLEEREFGRRAYMEKNRDTSLRCSLNFIAIQNGAPGWKRDPSGPVVEDGAPGWKREDSDGAPPWKRIVIPPSNGAPGWKRDPSAPIAEDGAPGWKRATPPPGDAPPWKREHPGMNRAETRAARANARRGDGAPGW